MNNTLTAMQELIEWAKWFSEQANLAPHHVIKKATELLHKEKEQIVDAYNTWKDPELGNLSGEDYYKKTYANN